MASVNINSGVADQFYRYKMPRLLAKVEGKGNGIKTVIVNMPEIARALARPPTYPTKYFGCELGAQTQFDIKNERFIVNGAHTSDKLQGLLDGFIKKFVLCPECGNPETNLTVQAKRQTISQRCIACGHTNQVDMRHKLTTYIVKNPPDMDLSAPAATPTKGKKAKKEAKVKKAVNGDKEEAADRASPEANAQQQLIAAQQQMAAQRATGGVIDAPPEVINTAEEDDDDWGEDVSEEAVKQRMLELSEAAKGLALNVDLEKSLEQRMDMFYRYVQQKRDTHSLVGNDKDVLAEAERLDVKDKSTLVLVELLFNNHIVQQIKQHRVLFLRFCHQNQKAQRYLLGGVEQLIGNLHKAVLLPKTPHILKVLYESDILEEEILIEWSQKVSKKYVSKEVSKEIHDKADPFIKWLEEAEEEESESEEEDHETMVSFSKTGRVGAQAVPVPKAEDDDDDDDFDIEAI